MMKIFLLLAFIATSQQSIGRDSSGNHILSLRFAAGTAASERPIIVSYLDRFNDYKTILLQPVRDSIWRIPFEVKHEVITYGLNMQSYSYLVDTDDSLVVTYTADHIPVVTSLSGNSLCAASWEINQKSEDLRYPKDLSINRRNLAYYGARIDTVLKKRLSILNSFKSRLTKEEYGALYSEIRTRYLFNKMAPVYPDSRVSIDSLSDIWKREIESIPGLINSAQVDASLSSVRLLAYNYLRFYLAKIHSAGDLSSLNDLSYKYFNRNMADFISFKYINDNYEDLRLIEKNAIARYKAASSGHLREYLSSIETKYDTRHVNFSGGSLGDIRLYTPQNTYSTFKDLLKNMVTPLVFVDLWASWCVPCRWEIPYTLKHANSQEKYARNMSVVLVSIDSEEAPWLEAVKKDSLDGFKNSYILKKDDIQLLSKAVQIEGIPRYLIIHQSGAVLVQDAIRPSDANFKSIIEKYARYSAIYEKTLMDSK